MHLWPNSLNSLQVCWWCYTLNNNNIDLIPMFRKCMFFSQVCWWCPAREDQCHCRSRAQGGILPFLSLCLFFSNYGIQECLLFRDRATSASGAHMSREWWSSGRWWRSSTSVIRTKPTAASNETDRDVSSAALKKYWTPAKSTMQAASWCAIDIAQDHLLEPSSLTDANPKWPVHWYCLFWLRFRWGPSPPSPLRAFFGAALVAAYKEIYLSYSTENTKPL